MEFEPTVSEAKRPDLRKDLEVGRRRRGGRQSEPIQVQPPVESAEGNSLTPLPAKHLSRREKQLVYSKRNYQKNKAEKLASQNRYNQEHKKEIRVYKREYMREYREGKRRRVQAEPQ
jgi:hypothetical protein